MVQFGTMEYFQKLAETCNASEDMKKTGMSVTMIYETTDMTPSRYFLKFEKGQVTEVREAKPGEDVDMQYIAKKEIYGRMFTGKLKGEDAMKTGWLKCNYKLGKMLRYGAAFNVFNKVISSIPAEY